MNNDNEINFEVNPSSNTAITTLIMLANAGYDQAVAILEKMGVEKEKIFHGIDREDMINRVFRVSVQGRMDTITAPELLKQFREAGEGIEAICVDVSRMPYVSSAGLRVLLSAHKVMSTKGGMKIKNVNEIVQEVFEVTGFSDILTIEA